MTTNPVITTTDTLQSDILKPKTTNATVSFRSDGGISIGNSSNSQSVVLTSPVNGQLSIAGNLNLTNHQALNLKLENLSSSPVAGQTGRIWYRTDTQNIEIDTGSLIATVGHYDLATDSASGLMSPEQVIKIDTIESAAQVNPVIQDHGTVLGIGEVALNFTGPHVSSSFSGGLVASITVQYTGDVGTTTQGYLNNSTASTPVIIRDSDGLSIKNDGATQSVNLKTTGSSELTITGTVKISGNIDLNENQALNFRLENLSSAPGAGNIGRLFVRTDTSPKKIQFDDGSAIHDITYGSSVSGLSGQLSDAQKISVLDEGVSIGTVDTINFIGTPVTATLNGSRVDVTISGTGGGGGSDYSLLYTNTADSNTVSSSATETSFNKTFDLPANTLTVGSVLKIAASGNLSTLSTPSQTVTWKIKYGSVVLATHTGSLNVTGSQWSIDLEGVCRSTGVSGSLSVDSEISIDGNLEESVQGTVSTIDTTTLSTLSITFQFGTSSSSNTNVLHTISVATLASNANANAYKLISANISDSAAISNTTTETAFNVTAPVSGGILDVGSVLNVAISGAISTLASPEQMFTWKIKYGSVVLATHTQTLTASNSEWTINLRGIIRSAGTSGTIYATSVAELDSSLEQSVVGGSSTIDTINGGTVSVTLTWQTASSSNSATLTGLIVSSEFLNASSMPDASTTVKGATMLSAAPTLATSPIAYGVTDTTVVVTSGSHAFTAPQSGVTPTSSSHLATKGYVDSIVPSSSSSMTFVSYPFQQNLNNGTPLSGYYITEQLHEALNPSSVAGDTFYFEILFEISTGTADLIFATDEFGAPPPANRITQTIVTGSAVDNRWLFTLSVLSTSGSNNVQTDGYSISGAGVISFFARTRFTIDFTKHYAFQLGISTTSPQVYAYNRFWKGVI